MYPGERYAWQSMRACLKYHEEAFYNASLAFKYPIGLYLVNTIWALCFQILLDFSDDL